MNYDDNDLSCPKCGSYETRKVESTSALSGEGGKSVFSASIACVAIGYAFFDMAKVFFLQVVGVGMLILGVVSFLSAMFSGNLSAGYDVYFCKRCGHQFKKHYSASERVPSVPNIFQRMTNKLDEWNKKLAKKNNANNTSNSNTQDTPWYKEPLNWFIVVVIIIAIYNNHH